MNMIQIRPLIPELCIAGALLSGLWLGVLQPRERALGEQLRAEHELRQRVSDVTTNPGMLDQSTGALRSLAERLACVERRAAMLADESEAFTQFMSLGERLGVRIDQVMPTGVMNQGAGGSASPGTPNTGTDASASSLADRRLGVDLSLRGPFPAIVLFVETVQRDLGIVHIRSLRIAPPVEPGSTIVSADLGCDVLLPDVSAVRKALAIDTPPSGSPATPETNR